MELSCKAFSNGNGGFATGYSLMRFVSTMRIHAERGISNLKSGVWVELTSPIGLETEPPKCHLLASEPPFESAPDRAGGSLQLFLPTRIVVTIGS